MGNFQHNLNSLLAVIYQKVHNRSSFNAFKVSAVDFLAMINWLFSHTLFLLAHRIFHSNDFESFSQAKETSLPRLQHRFIILRRGKKRVPCAVVFNSRAARCERKKFLQLNANLNAQVQRHEITERLLSNSN